MQNSKFHIHAKKISVALGLLALLTFQNCAKVGVEDLSTSNASTGLPVDDSGIPQDPGDGEPVLHQQKTILKSDQSPLDIVLIIDNSGSMKPDSVSLANKLGGFIDTLEDLSMDWQMCLITSDLAATNGKSHPWVGQSGARAHILARGASDVGSIIVNTVNNLAFNTTNSGDERAIASLRKHLDLRSTNNCYRTGSVVTSIVISDEDERSIGGNRDLYTAYYTSAKLDEQSKDKPMEAIDFATNMNAAFKSALPSNKLVSNSIVVQSGDMACFDTQRFQKDSIAFWGKQYEALSSLTGGAVGSICAADYGPVLSKFASVINKSYKAVQLECNPISAITVQAADGSQMSYTRSGMTLNFETSLSQDLEISISYMCAGQ